MTGSTSRISLSEFQSSPSPKAGSYHDNPQDEAWLKVSILSQPEGRELHCVVVDLDETKEFQSSPSPKAGSYFHLLFSEAKVHKFQSSPSPKAGSYGNFGLGKPLMRVSILSQPEGRELRENRS